MTLLVTFDGAKGVGKSTLIDALGQALAERGIAACRLVEKDLMSKLQGDALAAAYARRRERNDRMANMALASLHRRGRVIISNTTLAKTDAALVLMDRWYPSDAVFRSHVDVTALIEANLACGVREPDIAVAVLCDPEESWKRACQRPRELDSKVIDSFEQHAASTDRFELAAYTHSWRTLRSDLNTPLKLVEQLMPEILCAL